MDVSFGLGDDPRDADSLQNQRTADARFDVLALPDDGDLGAIDAERQERLFVRAVSLGRQRGVIGCIRDPPSAISMAVTS